MTEEKEIKSIRHEKKEEQPPEKLEKGNLKKKKKPKITPVWGMKLWWAVMGVYLLIFGYIGYIAFWPMAFNDPDNTVKKYLTILGEYQAIIKTDERLDQLKLAMEELMKKAEESANDIQQLASQSFNIVLGAFLAFLSATVTKIFQGRASQKKEPGSDETETG